MEYYSPERDAALQALYPGKKYRWNGQDFSGLSFEDGTIVKEPALKAQIEIENSKISVLIQKFDCIRLLNESEIHVSNDPPYPADVGEWIEARAKWRATLKSEKLEEIAEKPF